MLWNVGANLLGLMIALFNAWSVTFAPEVVQSVKVGDTRPHSFESTGAIRSAAPDSPRVTDEAQTNQNSRNGMYLASRQQRAH